MHAVGRVAASLNSLAALTWLGLHVGHEEPSCIWHGRPRAGLIWKRKSRSGMIISNVKELSKHGLVPPHVVCAAPPGVPLQSGGYDMLRTAIGGI